MAAADNSQIDKVMLVAGQLFAAHGYDGVGVREIASKSGLKPATIFYHFGNKESLYLEVIDYKYEAAQADICRAMEKFDCPTLKLDCVIGGIYDLLLQDRVMMLLMQRDILDVVAHSKRRRFHEEYSRFVALIQNSLRTALGSSYSADLAFSLLSLLLGHCELTAALMYDMPDSKRDLYQVSQRALLLKAGRRLCLLQAEN